MRKVWSEIEKNFIREHIGMKDIDVLAYLTKITGRNISLGSLRKQRQRMGLYKESGRGLSKLRVVQGENYGI